MTDLNGKERFTVFLEDLSWVFCNSHNDPHVTDVTSCPEFRDGVKACHQFFVSLYFANFSVSIVIQPMFISMVMNNE